jgi:hypothetical protein
MSAIKSENTVLESYVSPIQLNWQEKNSVVTVIPGDEKLFYITIEKAIEACRAKNESVIFINQFMRLLNKLALWNKNHENDISNAFLTVRDANLLFLIVKKSVKFDSEFEDELTDLDIEIAQDKKFNKIKLSVLALPQTDFHSINSFLTPDSTFKYNISNNAK